MPRTTPRFPARLLAGGRTAPAPPPALLCARLRHKGPRPRPPGQLPAGPRGPGGRRDPQPPQRGRLDEQRGPPRPIREADRGRPLLRPRPRVRRGVQPRLDEQRVRAPGAGGCWRGREVLHARPPPPAGLRRGLVLQGEGAECVRGPRGGTGVPLPRALPPPRVPVGPGPDGSTGGKGLNLDREQGRPWDRCGGALEALTECGVCGASFERPDLLEIPDSAPCPTCTAPVEVTLVCKACDSVYPLSA